MRKFINESIFSRGSCNFLRSTDGEKMSEEGKEKVLRVVVFYTRKKAQLQVKKALPLVAPF